MAKQWRPGDPITAGDLSRMERGAGRPIEQPGASISRDAVAARTPAKSGRVQVARVVGYSCDGANSSYSPGGALVVIEREFSNWAVNEWQELSIPWYYRNSYNAPRVVAPPITTSPSWRALATPDNLPVFPARFVHGLHADGVLGPTLPTAPVGTTYTEGGYSNVVNLGAWPGEHVLVSMPSHTITGEASYTQHVPGAVIVAAAAKRNLWFASSFTATALTVHKPFSVVAMPEENYFSASADKRYGVTGGWVPKSSAYPIRQLAAYGGSESTGVESLLAMCRPRFYPEWARVKTGLSLASGHVCGVGPSDGDGGQLWRGIPGFVVAPYEFDNAASDYIPTITYYNEVLAANDTITVASVMEAPHGTRYVGKVGAFTLPGGAATLTCGFYSGGYQWYDGVTSFGGVTLPAFTVVAKNETDKQLDAGNIVVFEEVTEQADVAAATRRRYVIREAVNAAVNTGPANYPTMLKTTLAANLSSGSATATVSSAATVVGPEHAAYLATPGGGPQPPTSVNNTGLSGSSGDNALIIGSHDVGGAATWYLIRVW